MIRVEREIDVARSAEAVFERLTRIEELPRWQPAIREATLTSPGPIGLNSTVRLVVEAGGQRTDATGRITDFVRPERIGLEANAGPADIVANVAVRPIDDGSSRLTVRTEIKLGGMLRFVEGMVRGRIEAEAPAAAAAIKAWLESD